MATNLPSSFFIQFLEQLLTFLVNFTLLKYVKSQRSYGFLITKELIFGFQILDLKDHFSASLTSSVCKTCQFLEQLLTFLVNFTLLKYVKSQRSYGFLITKELIFGFQILDLKDHFSTSLTSSICKTCHL